MQHKGHCNEVLNISGFFLELGIVPEDKSLDAIQIVNKTDVIKAMEVIEGENIKRKKTPPTGDADKKKQLIR